MDIPSSKKEPSVEVLSVEKSVVEQCDEEESVEQCEEKLSMEKSVEEQSEEKLSVEESVEEQCEEEPSIEEPSEEKLSVEVWSSGTVSGFAVEEENVEESVGESSMEVQKPLPKIRLEGRRRIVEFRRQWEPVFLNPKIFQFKCGHNSAVREALKARGWQEVLDDSGDWDVFWCSARDKLETFSRHLKDHQRISKFPNHIQISQKDLMTKNLKQYRLQVIETKSQKIADKTCSFLPISYQIPEEYSLFLEHCKERPEATWIIKTTTGSLSKEIVIFNDFDKFLLWNAEISARERGKFSLDLTRKDPTLVILFRKKNYVIQQYVVNPYLIKETKFVLHIYALVTRVDPLQLWLHREGLVRFASIKYVAHDFKKTSAHITNISCTEEIARSPNDSLLRKTDNLMWSISQLREFLMNKHGEKVDSVLNEKVNSVWNEITEIIITSMLSVDEVVTYDKHSFGLYRYEFLLDDKLKPWLLDINSSPSLMISCETEKTVNLRVVDDVLNTLDLEKQFMFSGNEKRVGGFDLIWNKKRIYPDQVAGHTMTSTFGFVDDCTAQLDFLRKIAETKVVSRIET